MESTALYIHIPFCKQKCLYCDFPSFHGMEALMPLYIEALCKEIESIGQKKISTIFIGGGTPTYLSFECLDRLLKCINSLNLASEIEFTIEGNPGTFTEEKLKLLKAMGVNRLSIGLQAVQDDLLKKLGRIHNYKQFLESYSIARKAGFKNINIDLMFGLPQQTLEMWKETLEKVLVLEPTHLSCYSLILEEDTPFFEMYSEEDLPEENVEREMYLYTKQKLEEKGFLQYEISNFSKNGYECKHNLVYWNLQNYLGVGSASHSYYNGIRYSNERDVKKYIDNILLNGTSIVETHENSNHDDMEEFMFLGLRKIEGISIREFNDRFHKDIYSVYGEIIKKYVDQNLLIVASDRLMLTEKGIEVSNLIMSEFIL